MMIPAGFAQVNLQFTGSGVPTGAEMTFGVKANTVTNATDIAELAGDACVTANIRSLYTSGMTLSNVHAKIGPNVSGPSGDSVETQTGTAGGDTSPPNVALLIKKSTAVGGRKGSGRMFLPCIAENRTDAGGGITSTLLTAAQTVFDDLRSELIALDIDMVLLHNDATTPNDVTALTVQALAATQRRRLRR